MLIVGGSGDHRGAIAGAVVAWAIWTGSGALLDQFIAPEYKAQAAALKVAAIGAALCVVLLFRPQGLFSSWSRSRRSA